MPGTEYDLVVIGGGAAGLTAAGLGASLGARTTLIERARLGGDCTWTGCVPSKALLHAAEIVHTIREGHPGVSAGELQIDGRAILAEVRRVRHQIYEESDAPPVLHTFGIDTREGSASFVDAHTVSIVSGSGTERLSSKYFIIAAGAEPAMVSIDGLSPERLLTTDTLFDLEGFPASLAIIGAGPIGLEISQALTRLGVVVHVIERSARGGGARFEGNHSDLIVRQLESEGVTFHFDATVSKARDDGSGGHALVVSSSSGETAEIVTERVLVATGRQPRLEGLGLEKADVAHDAEGVVINQSCQTSQAHIYACGDIAKGPDFTHVAEDMAKTAVKRLLLKVPGSRERALIPEVLYTSPEIARVGERSEELEERKAQYRTIRFPYNRIDRARITGKTAGEICIHYAPLSGKVLGCHIVGVHAGEMIHEIALAMAQNVTLREISSTMHAYPTFAQGVRRAADQIYVQTGSTAPLKFLGSLFGYRGEVSEKIGGDEVL